MPFAVKALESITKDLDEWFGILGISNKTELLRKSEMLGSAKILRKDLED